MTSEVDVCNRALQKLGAKRIVSLTEDSPNARDCNAVYSTLRRSELRKNVWNFARKRATLAPDATAPAFGFSQQFTLPADFLRLTQNNKGDVAGTGRRTSFGQPTVDYQIEGKKLLTNEGTVVRLLYVADISDPNLFDPLFVEALASKIAEELAEKITQSNTKRQLATQAYKDAVAEAKRANAIENQPVIPAEDTWVSERA